MAAVEQTNPARSIEGDADDARPFHARDHATLTSRVQREVERRILSGEIESGARIGEAALADSLGVSRGPVREALRCLAQAGLVELVVNKGAIVRSIGLDEVRGLYHLRGAIFALACQELAQRATAEDVALLEGNMAEMRAALAADDMDRYYRLNVAFHAAILARCGNTRASELYQGIVKEMHLFRRRSLSHVPNAAASLAEHAEIVAAVVAGDRDGAREAGRLHVEHGCRRFLSSLDEA